ncbi:hypothetical protein ROLI_041210 [Roseobacter fucihabitans]|uniref:Transposase IS200-like domain-containing protein n=1 Tax=Roseobacter fucihabitans TaxID=1537242 RepID=A0ABZ2BY54_9RHOB|nr:IS200/IS605 family transposase [Roseobacter litoralis]MBC6965897.1 Transposase IS200 like protein [Roseobacter litoralis]MBC6967785.1 Transposase IS200 like protein [Roseobacter litoralis]
MQYSTGKHCVYYHRYHLVWSTKYRFKVLCGLLRLRVRDICRQVCAQSGVEIIKGVLSSDHVHMFVSVPPKLAISDLVRLMKGRSSHKIQQALPAHSSGDPQDAHLSVKQSELAPASGCP